MPGAFFPFRFFPVSVAVIERWTSSGRSPLAARRSPIAHAGGSWDERVAVHPC